jgi:hypothetical protein
MSRAEYMREYRKRKKLQARGFDVSGDVTMDLTPANGEPLHFRAKTLAELVEQLANEVMRLTNLLNAGTRNPYTEFRPVPKIGKR